MDPISWTVIAAGATAASAAVGIGSTVMGTAQKTKADRQAAAASAKQLGYQAGVADYNAKVARQNRDWELKVGGDEGVRYGMGARARMGAIRTKQAASGIDIRSKTAENVRYSQEYVTEIDRRKIADNAARKAYGYETEALTKEAQAEIYRQGANDALISGNTAATASLLSGVTSVADKWYQASASGVFAPNKSGYLYGEAGGPIGHPTGSSGWGA